ncbi:MAG: filamentous hemagglutinin N-terminal domain-containing protein, partial [Rhodocyclaceae bacterium]|nr:filamentous hemagglutinin N-terminal domain-containing protein [Rhodocyclaceae bacterium]
MSRKNLNCRHFAISRLSPVAVAVSLCFAGTAYGLPVAPTVVNGSASFAQSGNVLNVANSNGAIINWQTFGIGSGERVHFEQLSASSQVLNRVLAADPSVIYGTLSSNGRVWLVNPAGILVGAGARIDTAGFVASALPIKNEDFLANKLT